MIKQCSKQEHTVCVHIRGGSRFVCGGGGGREIVGGVRVRVRVVETSIRKIMHIMYQNKGEA